MWHSYKCRALHRPLDLASISCRSCLTITYHYCISRYCFNYEAFLAHVAHVAHVFLSQKISAETLYSAFECLKFSLRTEAVPAFRPPNAASRSKSIMPNPCNSDCPFFEVSGCTICEWQRRCTFNASCNARAGSIWRTFWWLFKLSFFFLRGFILGTSQYVEPVTHYVCRCHIAEIDCRRMPG